MIEPGIHDLDAAVYHADPCPEPSLSRSIANLLCTASPAHARAAHPRLNPDYAPESEEKFDIGTAAHAWLLEGKDVTVAVDAKDWRTKAAQAERDAARAAGLTPLLLDQWERVKAMVGSVLAQLSELKVDPLPFSNGKPEQTLLWQEDGVWCRALCDWLRDDRAYIDDFKTTAGSANPETWSKSMFGIGLDMQAAFYTRGLKYLTGSDAVFRFVVAETHPPYAVSVMTPGPDVIALSEAKVEYAINRWRECLAADVWPGYRPELATTELPAYEEMRWMDKMGREGLTASGQVAA